MAIPRFQKETSILHCQVSLPCVASHQKRLSGRETEHLSSEKMSWRCVHPQVNFPTKHLDSQLNQTKGLALKVSNAEIQLRINTSPSPATQSWNLYSRHHEVCSMQSNLHSIHQLQKAPPVTGSALWCRIAHWALLRKAKLDSHSTFLYNPCGHIQAGVRPTP